MNFINYEVLSAVDMRKDAPDVREKLVELFYDNNVRCDQKIEGLAEDVMDIVANGVTAQEGISQVEFPWMGEEIAKLCIRYMEDYADFHGYASSKKVKEHIVRLLELEKDGRIAILPQPPKGE
jgi:hypothetical protein